MLKRMLAKRSEFLAFCLITFLVNFAMNGGAQLLLRAGTLPSGEPCDSGADIGSYTNLAGDATGEGVLSILDPVLVLGFLFGGGPPPVVNCDAAAVALPFTDKEIDVLLELLDHMEFVNLTYPDLETTDPDDVKDYRTLRFNEINMQLVNGLGATNGTPTDPFTSSAGTTHVNGLGNFVIGYNEERADPPDPATFLPTERSGSHNLIVGARHNYTSYGGTLGGRCNQTNGPYDTCVGGTYNKTSSICSSIVGGCRNVAEAAYAQVTGGRNNTASANYSVCVGGGGPEPEDGNDVIAPAGPHIGADARYAVVLGGRSNLANRTYAVVCGGRLNIANGESSVVVGGGGELVEDGNLTIADYSVVGGGSSNITVEENAAGDPVVASVVAGGRNNSTSANYATVSGGGGPDPVDGNVASGDYSAVSAGRANVSSGEASCVGGGDEDEASGIFDWVGGDDLFTDG